MTTVVWPERVTQGERLGKARVMAQDVAGAERVGDGGRVYRVIMAGGGTGGHLYPGLAVAEALEKRLGAGGVELVWAATPRKVDQHLLGKFGDQYIRQSVQPLVKQVGKLWAFWRGWRETCRFWNAYMDQNPVDCVVALGGYAAGPAAYVGAKRGVKVVLLNPDAVAGRANRFLLRRSDVVVTQWSMGGGGGGVKVKALGCPIRRELFGVTREEGVRRLGVGGGVKTLVVTGASLGAKTINDAVVALLGDGEVRGAFEGQWQILHLAGTEQAAEVRAAYGRFPGVRVKVFDYCDDMASVWAVADLAIARAGASTCAELTACGVPSILLPYPFHKDMHQRANAAELVKIGAAVMIDDAKDVQRNAAAVKTVLQMLLYDDQQRGKMADAARRAGKPAAADAIAGEIVALVGASLR